MKKKIVSRFFFRWRHISSSKFDQDFLIFFDGQYKLKSESSSLAKLWATKEEPKWNPSLTVEPIPKPGRPKCNSNMSVILFGRSILGIRLDTRLRLHFILQRVFSFFFFFYYYFKPQLLTNSPVALFMGPTALFTHSKFILLQCFQFSVFSFSKISSIQTDPRWQRNVASVIKYSDMRLRRRIISSHGRSAQWKTQITSIIMRALQRRVKITICCFHWIRMWKLQTRV